MNEEKKVYSVIGTVTIGTDEYRDMLTEKFQALKDKECEHERWYQQYVKANDLEKRNKELMEKVNMLSAYIDENGLTDKVELWVVKKSRLSKEV